MCAPGLDGVMWKNVHFGEKLIWDTGIEKSVVVLKFRDKEIYLKGTKEIPFSNYRMVRQAKPLFVYKGRNLLGPVELISVVYKEQICEIRDWGIEGAYQEAARRTQDFCGRNCLLIIR